MPHSTQLNSRNNIHFTFKFYDTFANLSRGNSDENKFLTGFNSFHEKFHKKSIYDKVKRSDLGFVESTCF